MVDTTTINLKLSQCRKLAFTVYCASCGKEDTRTNRCGIRICPKCAGFLFKRTQARVMALLRQFHNAPSFLTLTAPPESFSMQEGKSKLFHAFKLLVRKLHRRGFTICAHVKVYELTRESGRLNHHLHVLMDAKFIPQKLISDLWNEALHAPIVWIQRLARQGAASYLSKYVSKGSNLSVAEYVECYYRKRWFSTSLDTQGISGTPSHGSKCRFCGGFVVSVFSLMDIPTNFKKEKPPNRMEGLACWN